jgi:radical SAM superfamily enzyme YgiQ (UPF0313 family)
MKRRLQVLLINPPIYDVSAFGFWSSPLGLLYVGAVLRQNGMDVALLDCVKEVEERRADDGRAPFVKQKVPVPEVLRGTGETFRRYGLPEDQVALRLRGMPDPDLVLITCIMTYWYQGAAEMVRVSRQIFPSAKIVVGGVYPSLCHEHAAAHMRGANLVVGRNGLTQLYPFIEEAFQCTLPFKPFPDDLETMPYPVFDLYDERPFVPLLTSVGCAYKCTYCATSYLRPRIARRTPDNVLREIEHWHDRGVSRFALYDDNFLFKAHAYSKPLLASIARLPFEPAFYNPNALNAALVDRESAALLKRAGFREVRIGLETVEPALMSTTGGKVSLDVFERAVAALREEGFVGSSVKAYVLAGLPRQRREEVVRAVDYAAALGVYVSLAEYTPIPHTPMVEQNLHLARYPVTKEPLFQNNALFPFAWEGFTEGDMNRLKSYTRKKNDNLDPPA